jgi:hypothetical protein
MIEQTILSLIIFLEAAEFACVENLVASIHVRVRLIAAHERNRE